MPDFGTTFAAKIKYHSKTLDRFKERKRVVVGGPGGGGSWETECTIKQIEIIKPQQKE